jgi:hypothetical protein
MKNYELRTTNYKSRFSKILCVVGVLNHPTKVTRRRLRQMKSAEKFRRAMSATLA